MWGLNDSNKRKVIKAAFRRWRPHVLCLQETKMGSVDRRVIGSIGGGRWFDWDFLGSVGASEGILIMWDRRVVSRMGGFSGKWTLSCLMKMVENDRK